ncbi:MAG: acyl-CoA dehydrogenase family protein, partial [Chloroflexota bacterium]|nr:acyl-CoA dehydrogenase family protein [Chloroflexota bacterium]
AAYREFVAGEVAPHADAWDQAECVPRAAIDRLAAEGYLGAILPASVGGLGLDMPALGILHEEVGRGCSSMRSLLTVHSMLAYSISRWGNRAQKDRWLEPLAAGTALGAFALTEPNIGSDARSVQTTATRSGSGFVLDGCKRWITFGQVADVFVLFARCDDKPTAFLLERNTPGLSVQPLHGILGTRASMLAELRLEGCEIPRESVIGGLGFGFAAVGASALDIGRFSVASGSVGIGQACLDASLHYASERSQYGSKLKDHQLIAQMVTDMVTNVRAARLLCYEAAYLKEAGDLQATTALLVAKYFASTMAARAASDAVQIHGANGCGPGASVQRYYRDAKVMEIIEGSSQIQQITIAMQAFQAFDLERFTTPAAPAPR